jgi:hypothetical protein
LIDIKIVFFIYYVAVGRLHLYPKKLKMTLDEDKLNTSANASSIAAYQQTINQENEWLAQVLGEQFDAVQEYCNAQTTLSNATQDESTIMLESIVQLDEALRRVKTNYESLTSRALLSARRNQALQEHIELTQRVLKTVHDARNSHGILLAGSSSMPTKTVALAALRASESRVRSFLGIVSQSKQEPTTAVT